MSNVRGFGAKGDGVNDDTEAIEHALKMGDGTLEFPRGEYRITRTIVIELANHGRFAVSGSGGTAKLLMEGAGPVFRLLGTHSKTADPNGFRDEEWQFERMPTFTQFEIEGRHPEADGLEISGIMQPTFEGILIRKVRNGIRFFDRARNILISHCHIYHNTGIGVFFDNINLHQTNIVGSHISYNRLGGIRIENSEIRNFQVTGCDIEYNNNRAFGVPDADDVPTAEIYIDCGETGTVREGTISSCTIQATYSPNGANIRIIGSRTPESQKAGMWCITGNLIGSQATNVHLTHCRGITFEGNYIYSGHVRNLLVESSKSIVVGSNCFGHNPDYKEQELCTGIRLVDCENCTLTGVQIQDAQAGEHTVPNTVPIERMGLVELVRCRRMQLTGVQVLEGTPAAVYLEDCQDTLLTGCLINDAREMPLAEASIRWTGTGSGNLVSNCRANRPLEIAESAGVTATGVIVG